MELIPRAPASAPRGGAVEAPRVVGPGRRERGYLARLENLEERLSGAAAEQRKVESELETSLRLERGCQRLIDRMEVSWTEDRKRLDLAHAQQKRLVLTLGALQRENELLRERLELAAAPLEQLTAVPAPESESHGDAAAGTPAGESPRGRRGRKAGKQSSRAARPGLLARLFRSSSPR